MCVCVCVLFRIVSMDKILCIINLLLLLLLLAVRLTRAVKPNHRPAYRKACAALTCSYTAVDQTGVGEGGPLRCSPPAVHHNHSAPTLPAAVAGRSDHVHCHHTGLLPRTHHRGSAALFFFFSCWGGGGGGGVYLIIPFQLVCQGKASSGRVAVLKT